MKQDKALTTREAVRGRLNVTGAARRDAIEKSRRELPSYTDDELKEITGKFAALSANAAASAVADALTHRVGETAMQCEHEPAGILVRCARYVVEHPAQVSAAVAGIAGALASVAHWVAGWF